MNRIAPAYQLRPAVEADFGFFYRLQIETMGEVARQAFGLELAQEEAAMRRRLAERPYQVISVGDKDVGVLETGTSRGELVLNNIQLDPAHQRRGLGTAIVRDLLAQARAENRRLTLEVLKINPAWKFYAKLGFEITGEEGAFLCMEAH